MNLRRSPNDLITLHIYRKEWRLKAQVRPQTEVTTSITHHRDEVVATNIGRLVNHYRFALRTSSDMPPSASPHSRAPLRPAVLRAERANLTAKKPRL